MGKIYAIANQKGGVGKTTTALNLGVSFRKKGKKVLIVDMDPQSHLTYSFGYDPDKLHLTLSDILLQQIEDDAVTIKRDEYFLHKEDVDIIPSDAHLAGVENTLVNALGREKKFKDFIDELRNDYDYILLDCPPSLGMLFINALTAADSVIIPVQAQYLPAKGMELLLKDVARIRKQINKNLQIEGIVLTMFNKSTNLSKSVKSEIEAVYGSQIRVFGTVIPQSVKAAESPAKGESIFEHDPTGIIANSYKNLVEEILEYGRED